MLVAWMLPGDDDQPATRRDLSSARETMEHKVRADIAEVRTEIAELRTEMVNGFRGLDHKIAKLGQRVADLRTEMAALSTKQTRFLVGLMVVMNGTLLAAVLRTG